MLRISSVSKYTLKLATGRGIRLLSICLILLGGALTSPSLSAAELPDIIDRVQASVVAIGIYRPSSSPRQRFSGTGFVVGNGHLVVTNHHLLPTSLDEARREQLAVFSGRGRQARFHPVEIVARDSVHDLALLYITAPLPALALAKPRPVRAGTEILFTGFPIGMAVGLYPVTHRGIVSAISPMAPPQPGSKALTTKMILAMRDPYDVLQLDATAYPGNSGSPVFDRRDGRVVGVINSVLVKGSKEAASADPSGISYAIPVRFVHQLLEQAPQ